MVHSLILDTYEVVRKLRALPPEDGTMRWSAYVPTVVEDIMDCMGSAHTAPAQIRRLIEEIYAGRYEEFFPSKNYGLLAAAVQEVATMIYEQLKHMGIYSYSGELTFYNCKVVHQHFHDVLLVRKEYLMDATKKENTP